MQIILLVRTSVVPFPPLKVLCRELSRDGGCERSQKNAVKCGTVKEERQGDSVANLFEKRLIVSFSDSGRLDRDRDPY